MSTPSESADSKLSDLKQSIHRELDKYISLRTDSAELSFLSRVFRNEKLTERKLNLAFNIKNDISSISSLEAMSEYIKQATVLHGTIIYSNLTKSLMSKCFDAIDAMISKAESETESETESKTLSAKKPR